MNFNAQNILVINFGQIGDIILSLPAMQSIRARFPDSKITALIGKSANDVVEMSGLFDEIISVDRNELKKGNKLWAIKEIIKLIADVRRPKFDFVIDLHSLYETNLLGFASGANLRLFASRGNRSLDFLSNFRPKPPLIDRSLHITDYYLQNLKPLGITGDQNTFQFHPPKPHLEKVKNIFQDEGILEKELIGINLGAGHPSRCWSLDKFAELSRKLSKNEDSQVLVFYGPEERHLEKKIREIFPANVSIYDKFDLQQLAAAFSYLKVLVGNDTGPMHLGAIVGTPVVLITDPSNFLPLSENVHVIRSKRPEEVSIEDVFQETNKLLSK
jgi:ADP-heptose:LPS heptosyltransferase